MRRRTCFVLPAIQPVDRVARADSKQAHNLLEDDANVVRPAVAVFLPIAGSREVAQSAQPRKKKIRAAAHGDELRQARNAAA